MMRVAAFSGLLGLLLGVLVSMGGMLMWRWYAHSRPAGGPTVQDTGRLVDVATEEDAQVAKKAVPEDHSVGSQPRTQSQFEKSGKSPLQPAGEKKQPVDRQVKMGTAQPGTTSQYSPRLPKESPKGLLPLTKQPASQDIVPVSAPEGNGNLIFLSPQILTALRQQADQRTPQWKAFQARLDGFLEKLPDSIYQGSQLQWISDYALAYQVLKEKDFDTASKYADKAIALIKSAFRDYQKGGWVTFQLLAFGDGTRRSFQLPHTDIIPSSVRAYVSKINHIPVKRGPKTFDTVAYYSFYLKVSNTNGGPADYQEGVDWRHSPELPNNLIDWSLSGKKPAAGSTYYVTTVNAYKSIKVQRFEHSGSTLTLPTAPRADEAVLVEYIYGKHASDYSTLAYQQTSMGDGGFNSVLVDDTFSYRYLGKHIPMGLDWLDGYPGLSNALKKEAMDLLVRWSDYIRDHGYRANFPEGNYGAAAYCGRVMTALALRKRHRDGPRLLNEVLAYRQKILLQRLQAPNTSIKGGFWIEGWSYGFLAASNLILAGIALEHNAILKPDAERRWASEVVHHLISAQSSPGFVYDAGEWYTYPTKFLNKSLFRLLAVAADEAEARSYASYILQQYNQKDFVMEMDRHDYVDLLFNDQSTPASYWSKEPLQYFAPGGGLLTARSDWGKNPTWVAVQIGNRLRADHQSEMPGQVEIRKGADNLLINGVAPGNAGGLNWSDLGNIIILDDNGDGLQRWRYKTGFWYGTPGVVVKAYEATKDHTYIYGDYRAAYSGPKRPGDGGPAKELTRQVVYVRPDFIFVFDRVVTIKDTYAKQQRWHFLHAPTVDGTSFTATVGNSHLFGTTFSTVPLKAESESVKAGRVKVNRLIIQNAEPSSGVRYVTTFQVASGADPQVANARHVQSNDGLMEGAQLGDCLVLFGRDGDRKSDQAFSYMIKSRNAVNHLIANLTPGGRYSVKTDGSEVTSVTASAQGTVSFTTSTQGDRTVELNKLP